MANRLRTPDHPNDISGASLNEPMRLTYHGEPVIGIRTGEIGHSVMVYVGKDGVLKSTIAPRGGPDGFQFIDYLLETESVTLFGSAVDRSEGSDMVKLPGDERELIVPEYGSSDFSSIPNWTPYCVKNRRRGPMIAVLADRADGLGRMILYWGQSSQSQMMEMKESSLIQDQFSRMMDKSDLKKFRNHPGLKLCMKHPVFE